MKIYLIHQKSLAERMSKVMRLLFACDFVEDVEIVTSESSNIIFSTIEENNVLPNGFPKHLIRSPERSLWHKHFRTYEKIANGGKPAIVLEDDVIFEPQDFDEFIKECENIPQDCDWCFFGTGLGMKLPGKGFIKNNNHLKSRCTDSMIVHNKAAQIVYDDVSSGRVYTGIDWDLNYRFLKHNLTVYWYEPGFIVQGSENGTYQSTQGR